jgi:type I restriction-modification system DNA methylase subunit
VSNLKELKEQPENFNKGFSEGREIISKKEEFVKELADIFDLLARFDFEDKQKEKLYPNPDLRINQVKRSL